MSIFSRLFKSPQKTEVLATAAQSPSKYPTRDHIDEAIQDRLERQDKEDVTRAEAAVVYIFAPSLFFKPICLQKASLPVVDGVRFEVICYFLCRADIHLFQSHPHKREPIMQHMFREFESIAAIPLGLSHDAFATILQNRLGIYGRCVQEGTANFRTYFSSVVLDTFFANGKPNLQDFDIITQVIKLVPQADLTIEPCLMELESTDLPRMFDCIDDLVEGLSQRSTE
jgi:hypothetical protein